MIWPFRHFDFRCYEFRRYDFWRYDFRRCEFDVQYLSLIHDQEHSRIFWYFLSIDTLRTGIRTNDFLKDCFFELLNINRLSKHWHVRRTKDRLYKNFDYQKINNFLIKLIKNLTIKSSTLSKVWKIWMCVWSSRRLSAYQGSFLVIAYYGGTEVCKNNGPLAPVHRTTGSCTDH